LKELRNFLLQGFRVWVIPSRERDAEERVQIALRKQRRLDVPDDLVLLGFQNSVLPKVENRVLTDENVSTTTRHVDDAERHSLPLFNDPERADLLPGNRREGSVRQNSEATASTDVDPLGDPRSAL
jgi:hypothetical protein